MKIHIDWLVGFYGISTFVDYLMPNPFFFTNNQFYFKQFSLTGVLYIDLRPGQTCHSKDADVAYSIGVSGLG